ncbi:MAG TPA: cellulase family glycosylhydrolase, partial [Patescibacteria group bacterium]
MKKVFLSLFFVCFLVIAAFAFKEREGIIITTKDLLGVKPQQYYGTTVDMSQILPESKHYVLNNKGEDLIDIASRLGMNTLRITNINSTTDTLSSSYTHAQWQEVLDKMKKKNMYAIILIEANAKDTKFNRVTLDDYYINFVKNYIATPKACAFSNVLGVDIANEPLLNESNLAKMKEAATIVKSTCPSTKITIGSWRTDSGQKDSSGQPIFYWHDPKEVRQIE